jgi:hypothetical protein
MIVRTSRKMAGIVRRAAGFVLIALGALSISVLLTPVRHPWQPAGSRILAAVGLMAVGTVLVGKCR